MMHPIIKEQWVAALRDPSYIPGRGRLCDPETGLMCPLGVLCDIHRLETKQGRWNDGWYEALSGDSSAMCFLPVVVQEWAGLNSPYPQLGLYTIAQWNDGFLPDNGERFTPATPVEIANMIEECL